MQVNEHLIDITITFEHEYLASISLKTDAENAIVFGTPCPSTSISKLDPSSPELNVIFGFETGFSDEFLKELFIYRGSTIKRKKTATVISAEKYHKLVLKNNNDNFLDTSPNKTNGKKTDEFKDLMMKRLNEIQVEGEISSVFQSKSLNDNIWNEEKLEDQENACYEEEEKEFERVVDSKKRKNSLKSNSPKERNKNNVMFSARN